MGTLRSGAMARLAIDDDFGMRLPEADVRHR
jgi:hypothetical protein